MSFALLGLALFTTSCGPSAKRGTVIGGLAGAGTGAIVGIGDFAGPAELSELLVENDYVDACAVQQFLTFALGRPTSSYESAMVDEAIDSFRTGRHDFKEVIVDFIGSQRFARRAEERL